MTIYSLDVILSRFGASLWFHVQFYLLLLDLHKDFSGGRSGGLVFPSKNFPQFVAVHTVKGFGVVNKAEVDIFLEFSCFFDDPMDAGNLISGSSAFSKSSFNIWKFSVNILLNPCLENFEHYFATITLLVRWVQWCNSLSILWHCLSLGLEWKLTFSSPVAIAEFSKFAGVSVTALSQHHLLGFEIAQL